MLGEKIRKEYWIKNIDKTRHYLIEEMKQDNLMSKKRQKSLCLFKLHWALTYFSFFGHWLCFNFVFTSLVVISIDIASSAVELKICVITAGIKTYKSVIKKKRKKHDKIVLLARNKLSTIEVLVSKDLVKSYISHYEFVQTINVLKEYHDMEKQQQS